MVLNLIKLPSLLLQMPSLKSVLISFLFWHVAYYY